MEITDAIKVYRGMNQEQKDTVHILIGELMKKVCSNCEIELNTFITKNKVRRQ